MTTKQTRRDRKRTEYNIKKNKNIMKKTRRDRQ